MKIIDVCKLTYYICTRFRWVLYLYYVVDLSKLLYLSFELSLEL